MKLIASAPQVSVLAIAFLAVVLAACQTASPPPPAAPMEPAPAAAAAAPAPTAARDAAVAEVARLAAIADQDPLLAAWPGAYGGVPPWDKLNVAAFGKAFETGLALVLAEVDVIAENPDPPTFENTVVPLEDAGRHTDRSQTLFSILTSNLSTPEVQALDKEWSPKIAAAYDKIVFNPKLFARVAAIHAARDKSNLNPEQRRLVELTYDRLVRAGANLSAGDKEKVGKINEELAGLFTDFGNKVLTDENTWTVLESKRDLAGLSDSLIAAYKAAADERNLQGRWAVVNTRSSVDPFLSSSSRRDLREKVWKAFKNRGDNGGENDTNATIARIVKLRAERAKLLGYPTHAHWRMADTMAGDPEKAKTLMMRVWPAAVARVREEVKDMERLAKRDGVAAFEPWDYLYYAEKVRKAKYDLDQDELKPYFELNNMIAGSFHMAEQLYGLTFHEITGRVPVFLEGVRVWEVKDKTTGAHAGLFYGDYFARKGKRSGAWASGYRGRETFTGKTITPITSNNNNFVPGAPGEPVLISLDDAETLFHEFGHAIHSLVSEVNYPGLATTPRDFVEYPSQVHEMWVLTRPILDKYGLHDKTKKPMPAALLKK
ncbi:MAG TPA: M3 family metallopeptidase, partial [Thermoanaerobaculia bacterium]|nr:M3 family metallopeptidase [Thermoanaerobaculia bacterium]